MLLDNNSFLLLQDKLQDSIITLFVSLAIVYISQVYKKSFFLTLILFVSLLSLTNLIPIQRGSSLVQLIHGGIGDVSITSGLLLLMVIYKLLVKHSQSNVLSNFELIFIVFIGCILYLSAFGFINFDLYNLGYIERYKILVIFVLTILIMLIMDFTLGYIWLMALIAYYFNLLESHNFWDYLMDPILWLITIGNLIKRIVAVSRKAKKI